MTLIENEDRIGLLVHHLCFIYQFIELAKHMFPKDKNTGKNCILNEKQCMTIAEKVFEE